MSSFDLNCIIELTPSQTHDCGVDKVISWSNNGTHSDAQTYTFRYKLLTDLKPVYVTKTPHVSKLLKFNFTPISNNGSNIKVYINQIINGKKTIIQQYDLLTLSNSTSKYFNLLLDSNTKNDETLFVDVVTTNGTSGSFKCTIDCDPQFIIVNLCSGFTNNLTYACSQCPTVVKFYKQKPTLDNLANGSYVNVDDSYFESHLSGIWFKENLIDEVDENTIYSIKGKTLLKYRNSTNYANPGFYIYNDCSSSIGLTPCDTTVQLTHTTDSYTKTNPYVPTATGFQENGMKYSIQEVTIPVSSKYRLSQVTVSYDNAADDVCFTVTDGISTDNVGILGYSETYQRENYQPIVDNQKFTVRYKTSDAIDCFFNGCSYSTQKTIYVTTFTGYLKIRVACGFNKNTTIPHEIKTTVHISCGEEIYGYDMNVHPYSSWDAYHSLNVTTKLWSLIPISGWTSGTLIYQDPLLTTKALPYFYGDVVRTSPTNKVYQIGDVIKRSYGTHRNYKVTKHLFGPRKTVPVIDGPKDWTNNTCNRANPLGGNTLDCVYSCIEPTINNVGILKNIITSSSLKQPLAYSYLLGFANNSQPEYYANDDAFAAWNYATSTNFNVPKSKYYPCTGLEHMMAKLSRGYGLSINDPDLHEILNGDQFTILALGMIWGGGTFFKSQFDANDFYRNQSTFGNNRGYWEQIQDGFNGNDSWVQDDIIGDVTDPTLYDSQFIADAYTAYAYFVVAMTIAIILLGIFMEQSIEVNEFPCKSFRKRYSNTPFLKIGSPIYELVNLTGYAPGNYCDGSLFYNIPNNTTDGKITSSKLSYTMISGATRESAYVFDPSTTNEKQFYVNNFTKLMMLSYMAGFPETYQHELYMSAAISDVSVLQTNSVVGDLNNPLPIVHELPEGHFISFVSQQDADNQALQYLQSITGTTSNLHISAEEKSGVESVQLIFTHEIKNENTPNLNYYYYDNSDNSGLTIGKKIYIDSHGFKTALNGYYSINEVSGNFKKLYKLEYGEIVDTLTWVNESDSTVTSTVNGTLNVNTQHLDHTSDWHNDQTRHISNPDWNTEEFYNSPSVYKVMTTSGVTPDSMYVYDLNLNSNTITQADEGKYISIRDNRYVKYFTDYTIKVNSEEVCDVNNVNGVNFYTTDTSGNICASYVGVTFTADIYTGNNVLYESTTITIPPNKTNYFLELPIPNTGGTITNVNITIIS